MKTTHTAYYVYHSIVGSAYPYGFDVFRNVTFYIVFCGLLFVLRLLIVLPVLLVLRLVAN